MIKKLLCFVFVVITVFLFTVSASALSGSSYSDLPSISSQVTALVNYAMSFDDFVYSEWVCYRSDNNTYYLVWADEMTWSGSTVSANNVKYVTYYRESNTMSWRYGYGSDSKFTFSTAYLVTTNIHGLGSMSDTFETYYFQRNFMLLGILFTGFLLVIAFTSLKGGKK